MAAIPSLEVEVVEVDGSWVADAPWLTEPIVSTLNANDALFQAMDARARYRKR